MQEKAYVKFVPRTNETDYVEFFRGKGLTENFKISGVAILLIFGTLHAFLIKLLLRSVCFERARVFVSSRRHKWPPQHLSQSICGQLTVSRHPSG